MGGRIPWLLLPLLGGVCLLGGGAWLLCEEGAGVRGAAEVHEPPTMGPKAPSPPPDELAPAGSVPEVPLAVESPPREELAQLESEVRADASVIAGRVLWPDGRPAEALVRLEGGAAESLAESDRWMWTPANGLFRFTGLPAGSCQVDAKSWRLEQVEPGHFEKLTARVQRSAVAVGTTGLELLLDPGLRQTGRIVDAAGRPLEGVVFARPLASFDGSDTVSAFSSSTGGFSVPGIGVGRWLFVAQATGFLSSERELDLPSLEPLVFVLAAGASIRGLVLDERGAAVSGTHVMAGLVDPPGQGDFALSDTQGAFELVGLFAGLVLLSANLPGHTSDVRQVLTLAPGEVRTGVVLQMPACGRITGTLSEASGAPLADQTVSLVGEDDSRATARSDEQGRFEFAGVVVGDYRLRVGMLGGLELADAVTVRADETSVLDLRAPTRSLRLYGRVRVEGELAEVSVTVLRRDTQQQIARAASDEEGRYALELPGAGEYWIGVWSERLGANQWLPLTLPSVAAFEHDLELRLGHVSGTVWDGDGRRLAGLWVVAEQSSAPELGCGFGRALSDDGGDFELLLPPGTYALRVRESGGTGQESPLAPAAMQEVVVVPGARLANLDLVRTRGATLEGFVRRRDGSAVFGARLWIGPRGKPVESDLLGESSTFGRFRITGVPAGSWWVTASEGKNLAQWQRVELESGATQALEFVLD